MSAPRGVRGGSRRSTEAEVPKPSAADPPTRQAERIREDFSLLGPHDLHLFNEGTHRRLYQKLGAHAFEHGTYFAVWAPNAERVSVIGDFNYWDDTAHPLRPRGTSGIWEGTVPQAGKGQAYKYRIVSPRHGFSAEKADPFAFCSEVPPKTASVIWDLDYTWKDADWMASRKARNALDAPMSVYEVHAGSWRSGLSYRELGTQLAEHVQRLGFTHVEFLPLMEHPFYGSWGYQTTGYFAPTSRYGTPQDLMGMIDHLHQRGIGVILDWVPSHFPTDAHGLGYFDGTHLYEHADPQKGFHPDWQSYIFNYGRNEVRSFLLSSASYWLDAFHADGLRVDAVASMLYLDYSREEGEWIPNRFGGRENLEAVDLLRSLNESVYEQFPGAQTIAEESTAWPMVSRPNYVGGLGFGLKWDMGWMHDTLQYMSHDPVHRRFHHNELTFRALYAFTENYKLPLSHDEVVHGKGSLWSKMPGDEWQKFANLRLLYGYMHAQPGKKLLFMGAELAQRGEWNHEESLPWHLLDDAAHAGVSRFVGDVNRLHRTEPALHELDCDPAGFEWVDASDVEGSVISFLRRSRSGETVLVVCNFTPLVRDNYLVGVPDGGFWRELVNSDATEYGGSGVGNLGGVKSLPVPFHGRPRSLRLRLPPLGCLFLKK